MHIHQSPVADFADFINAVRELIAAIFDVHTRVTHVAIVAVDIGDA
jgi:hypothetical protein